MPARPSEKASRPRRATRAAPVASRKRPPGLLERLGAVIVGLASFAALLWSCRGALPGTPAADDYDYLYAVRFEHPLDPWGTMGSLWYWRPLSRQLYFAVFDGAFFRAPTVVAAAHAALFLALFVLLYRTARRAFPPLAAAAIASFPLLAEPSRALLAWPTGAQPLLAMVLIALAMHEAAARRIVAAAAALAAALLCHEQAILAAPILPMAVAFATRERAPRRRALFATAWVVLVYLAARIVATTHGAGLPARSGLGVALAALPGILGRSLAAQLDVVPGAGGLRALVPWAEAAFAALAIALLVRASNARARLREAAPGLAAGGAWFLLGIVPLAFAAELWTPRHTSLPGLGLGLLITGLLACAAPALAVAFAGVRLVALLLMPIAPPTVLLIPEPESTPLSFLHLTRLQRTAESARRVLTAAHPTLPHGTAVRYWSLPRQTQIAFAGPRALQVWYADSTLKWGFWERVGDVARAQAREPVLGFNVGVEWPAVLMKPDAVTGYEQAIALWSAGEMKRAEAEFVRADAAQRPMVGNFSNEIARLLARLAFFGGNYARADSLNRMDYAYAGESPSYFGMRALLSLQAGDRVAAKAAAQRALAFRADDPDGNEVMQALKADSVVFLPPARAPGPGSPPER